MFTKGEREMKNHILTFLFLVLLLGSTAACFAADTVMALPVQSKVVDVRAEIPPLNALTVSVTKITDTGTISTNAGSVDFGTLSYDSNLKRFKATCSYAVDASVASNGPAWTLTHTLAENVRLLNGTADLNCNINVTFFKWYNLVVNGSSATIPNPAVQLGRFSLTESNGKSFNSSTLQGQPLRIVYQIATGENDAPRVYPITADKPVGKYKGQIKITLVQ
jgi:hypothetical protein